MKTVTEFSGLQFLKNAYQQLKEIKAAGKTPEELVTAMGEALKIEGEKLSHVLNALEAVQDKVENLKRVIVVTLAEGEKAPAGSLQKEAFAYVSEFFPSLKPKGGRGGRDQQPEGRGGKRRGNRDKKGRGRRNDRGFSSGPNGTDKTAGPGEGRGRGPGRPGHANGRDGQAGGPAGEGGKNSDNRRPRFRPRGKGPRSADASKGPRPVIKPVGASASPELLAIRKEAQEATQTAEAPKTDKPTE